MKKFNIIVIIGLTLLVIMRIVSKINDSKMYHLIDNKFDKKELIAIVKLDNVQDKDKYIKDNNSIKVYEYSSEVIYLFIPKYKDILIEVYNEEELIYSINEPFILYGNDKLSISVKYKKKIVKYSLDGSDSKYIKIIK